MANIHKGSHYGSGPLRSREGVIGKSAVGSDEIQLRIDPIHADLDQEISGIHRKITQLKGVAQEIHSEAQFQNEFVNQLVAQEIHSEAQFQNEFVNQLVAQEIHSEAQFQNEFVNQLQMTLIKAQAGLKNNMRRLNNRIIQQGSNHVMHVVLFALLCFFAVYFWSKFSRR